MAMNLGVHHLSNTPTEAWREISKSQRVIKVTVRPPKTDFVPENKVRAVCMSDTHSLTPFIKFDIPPGDIFIHAGDFTRCGQLEEVIEFNKWIGEHQSISWIISVLSDHILCLHGITFICCQLPHKYKIVIAGNHELSFDPMFTHPLQNVSERCHHTGTSILDDLPTLGIPKDQISKAISTENVKQHLTNCIYLEDSITEIYGLKIYGTPWQPEFCKWAFNLPRGAECLSKWNLIPQGIDILITHTPPIGFGDLCCSGVRAGCVELLHTVQNRVRPKYHVFGHVHEGYGISSDGKIIYVNASTCDLNYMPTNPPIVFDVSLPDGSVKE